MEVSQRLMRRNSAFRGEIDTTVFLYLRKRDEILTLSELQV